MKNNNLIQNKITEREFNLHPDLADFGPVISRILSSRGITNKKQISYKLSSLAPISSLNNVDEAIEILLKYKKDKIVKDLKNKSAQLRHNLDGKSKEYLEESISLKPKIDEKEDIIFNLYLY